MGTPSPAHPKDVMVVINEMINHFNWKDNIGVGFPSIVKNGVCKSAANIPKTWIDKNLEDYFKKRTGLKCCFANDADIAGLAELQFGGYKSSKGLIILLTLGTGIGSALFNDGVLIPNSEFGHLLYKDSVFEDYASNNARKRNKWSFDQWGKHLNALIQHLERVLSPDLIILGGGISKSFEEFKHTLSPTNAKVQAAILQNNAGIIGAAVMAKNGLKVS
ncbi:UNVERIFIED_CONTAM: hypothetical protein GTU68_067187 [Idotea baltica]|nr:hypothetical protein [Idotea baltica]